MNYQQRASFIIRAGRLLAVGSRSGRVQVGSGPGRVGSGLNKKPGAAPGPAGVGLGMLL